MLPVRTEFSEKKLLKNKEMVFENGVKNIQAAAYNGARTVHNLVSLLGILTTHITRGDAAIFIADTVPFK